MTSRRPTADPGVSTVPLQTPRRLRPRLMRVPIVVRVDLARAEEAVLTATSVNLSPSGICLKVSEPLEIGSQLKAIIYVPDKREYEIFRAQLRVIWQKPDEDGFRTGAQFEVFAPGDERRLRSWLLVQGRPTESPKG